MSRIEKGCTAIVVKSYAGNEGRIVKVGSYIGNYKFYGDRSASKHCWETEPKLKATLEIYPVLLKKVNSNE